MVAAFVLVFLGLSFPSRTSEVAGHLHCDGRASQLSSPMEMQVIREVRADIVVGLSW